MIAEPLKSTLDTLSAANRHEVAAYLTKLELENDPDFWRSIRERSDEKDSPKWVAAEDL